MIKGYSREDKDNEWICSNCNVVNSSLLLECEFCKVQRRSVLFSTENKTTAMPPKKGNLFNNSTKIKEKQLLNKIKTLRDMGIEGSDMKLRALLLRNSLDLDRSINNYFDSNVQEETTSNSNNSTETFPFVLIDDESNVKGETTNEMKNSTPTTPTSQFVIIDEDSKENKTSVNESMADIKKKKNMRFLGNKDVHCFSNLRGTQVVQSGEEVHFVKENIGKKTWSGKGSRGGIAKRKREVQAVRLKTSSGREIGRLDGGIASILGPLMGTDFFCMRGVCTYCPYNVEIFTRIEISLRLFISLDAFQVFDKTNNERSPLAEPVYQLLQFVAFDIIDVVEDSSKKGKPEKEKNQNCSVNSEQDCQDHVNDTSTSDDALLHIYNSCSGKQVRDDHRVWNVAPPYLLGISLRDYQKEAVMWMIDRENNPNMDIDDVSLLTSELNSNSTTPMEQHCISKLSRVHEIWSERTFCDSTENYFVNPYQRAASLVKPPPPKPCRGGILADEMGLGKTIMILGLILCQRYPNVNPNGNTEDSLEEKMGLESMEIAGSKTTTTLSIGNETPANDSKSSSGTLVICPMSMLAQWRNEILNRTEKGKLKVSVYYGNERNFGQIGNWDVLITTYGVVSSEYLSKGKSSCLFSKIWSRIVLDEAHCIKNQSTGGYRSCAELNAVHRWCVTGTPIQNSLSDIYSLIRFLRHEPWSEPIWWQRVIAEPYATGDLTVLDRLKSVLSPLMLRRLKTSRDSNGEPIVALTEKVIDVVSLNLSEPERDFYTAVYSKMKMEFQGFVTNGTVMSSYVQILALLLRLRQACNHPFLVLGRSVSLKQSSDPIEMKTSLSDLYESLYNLKKDDEHEESSSLGLSSTSSTLSTPTLTTTTTKTTTTRTSSLTPTTYMKNIVADLQEQGIADQECPICLDVPTNPVLTPCAHLLCKLCLIDSMATMDEKLCPSCRCPVDMKQVIAIQENTNEEPVVDLIRNSSSNEIYLSTKLNQLLEDLESFSREDEATGEVTKIVVFSQWTHMLDIVECAMESRGMKSLRFDGGLNQQQREKTLKSFDEENGINILLISLKAGGVGLNLTAANVVILLDPWWNPAIEEQAIDRVHRLGQNKNVVVKKYVVQNSVEDVILELQERKRVLAKNVLAIGKSDRQEGRLSLQDLTRFFM